VIVLSLFVYVSRIITLSHTHTLNAHTKNLTLEHMCRLELSKERRRVSSKIVVQKCRQPCKSKTRLVYFVESEAHVVMSNACELTYLYLWLYLYVKTHIYIRTCTYICIYYVYVVANMSVCIYLSFYLSIYLSIYPFIYLSIYNYEYMYVYIWRLYVHIDTYMN